MKDTAISHQGAREKAGRVAAMQPYFFPYIGYFQLMKSVETFVIYDDVNFIKAGWINRNRIVVNGDDWMFSLPLKGSVHNKKIFTIELANDPRWKRKFKRTLQQEYRRSAYYDEVFPLVVSILESPKTNLADFLSDHLVVLAEYLSIDTRIVKTSQVYDNTDLGRQDRLIDICKREEARYYVNTIDGAGLYDGAHFKEKGVNLTLIRPHIEEYQQTSPDFLPRLSIIDVMMNNSVEEVRLMLDQFELISHNNL